MGLLGRDTIYKKNNPLSETNIMHKFCNLAFILGAIGSSASAAVQTQSAPQSNMYPYQAQPNQNYQNQPNQNYQAPPSQNQQRPNQYQGARMQNQSVYEAAPVQNSYQPQQQAPNQNYQRNAPANQNYQRNAPQQPANEPNQPQYLPSLSPEQIQQLKASAAAAQDWLKTLDDGQYGAAWAESSAIFQATLQQNRWVSLQDQLRKPMGRVISREMIDQRIALDPKGLPAGQYMVLIYNTTFSNKPSAIELVTLRMENGQWKVLTYQVK